MSKGFLGSLTAVLASAGLAAAQTSAPAVQMLPAPTAVVAPNQVALTPAPNGAANNATAADAKPAEKTPEKIASPKNAAPAAGNCSWSAQEQIALLAGQFYGSADYLLWWTKGHRLPPLVTAGPSDTLVGSGSAGVLGVVTPFGSTSVLFGNQEVDDHVRSGMRFTIGGWLDSDQTVGLEATALFLSQKGTGFAASSDGSTVLARPFITITPDLTDPTGLRTIQTETAYLIASSQQSGSVFATTTNEMWGAEANARIYAGGCATWRADMLAGFRYLQVKDNLSIISTSTALNGGFIPISFPFTADVTTTGSSRTVLDSFATKNDFYGGQLGAHVELKKNNFFADFTGKLALGVMHQDLTINGVTTGTNVTTLTSPSTFAPTMTFPGGLFARPGLNLGNHTRDEFGIVPEIGFNVGYQFGDHLKAWVGYTVVYFRSDVIRPGSQIDRVVADPSQPPATQARILGPVNFRDQDFWAQGINAGVEFSF
jgi:hypothetical protein